MYHQMYLSAAIFTTYRGPSAAGTKGLITVIRHCIQHHTMALRHFRSWTPTAHALTRPPSLTGGRELLLLSKAAAATRTRHSALCSVYHRHRRIVWEVQRIQQRRI